LVSTASSVEGNLPGPSDNVDKLNALFTKNKLTQEDMIALSGKPNLNQNILYSYMYLYHQDASMSKPINS